MTRSKDADYNARGDRLKRGLVPAVPFVVSLALSLSTIGANVYWQDSGLFLSAVKDAGILYPPGFVLYVVLCKAWTLLLFFLDFTLAVHLFSSVCVAGTVAILALAVRDLIRSQGTLFRGPPDADETLAGWSGIAAGSMAAGGFTLWFTGIYAKGYSFYYLILSLLIWSMIRADGSRKPRDFTIVALLIGLAWAAHPSAVCLALPLLLFVVHHRETVGVKGIARGVGIAAAVALAPSLIVLPLLNLRQPATALGDPRSLGELLDYAFGLRFMGRKGAFGLEPERMSSFGVFLWEEFLAAGLILLTIGFTSLVRTNRRLLLGLLAWIFPYSALAILFKVEGQHDCWFVAAWMPLHLMVGLGLYQGGLRFPVRARPVWAAGVAAVALIWAVQANRADLNQRNYPIAGYYGRVLLDGLDPDAILILNGDDSLAITGYFQRVRGLRPDVTIVAQPFLGLSFVGDRDWYDQRLLRDRPFLHMPDYAGMRARLPGVRPLGAHLAAFLEANAGRGRPVFTQVTLPAPLLPPGTALVPAGVLWKLVPAAEQTVDLKYWRFPIEPEDIQGHLRRARGLKLVHSGDRLIAEGEPYENRLLDLLLKGRLALGDVLVRTGKPTEAVRLLQTVRGMDSEYDHHPGFLSSLGQAYHALGQDEAAEPLLRRALHLGLASAPRGWAYYFLGEIVEKRGKATEAQALYVEASIAGKEDPRLLALLAGKHPPDSPKDK